jgi:ADP-dependent phosphofructokinase/glucokinase
VEETLPELLQQLTEAVTELDVPDDHLSGDRLTQVLSHDQSVGIDTTAVAAVATILQRLDHAVVGHRV